MARRFTTNIYIAFIAVGKNMFDIELRFCFNLLLELFCELIKVEKDRF